MDIAIYSLIGLNVVQFFFWSWNTNRLIDKLMSRNYADYVQSKLLTSQTTKQAGPSIPKLEDDDVLAELNKQFGAV